MQHIKWENLKIGNRKIDSQHLNLNLKLNKIIDNYNDRDKPNLDKNLIIFFDDVKQHFRSEEYFMRLISYPDLDFHFYAHYYFIRSFELTFNNLIYSHHFDYFEEIFTFHSNWFENHFIEMDKEIFKWLGNSRRSK